MRNKRKALKSLLRKASKVVILAGSLLVSTFSAAKACEVERDHESIGQRVNTVREGLLKKLDDSGSLNEELSYAEQELAQWGNWGNWNNWNNWRNWNNWNNWGNWRNY
jgi:hypothetical protein